MNRRHFIWIGILVAILPVAISAGASWFSNSHGCILNEGSIHSCLVNGVDYGPRLYELGLSFFYMFFTFPLGGIITAFGFTGKSKSSTNDPIIPSVPAAQNIPIGSSITPMNSGRSKRFIWWGLSLIFLPVIAQILQHFILSSLILGALGFITLFCVPLGIVLLIVGIVEYFISKK